MSEEAILQGETILWKEFDLAVCGFCAKQERETMQSNALVSTLVGDDLEWFGNHGILFMVHKLIANELEKLNMSNRCATHEASLETEMALNRTLRRQLAQLQRSSQDSDWRLQEQLATVVADLTAERATTQTLRAQVVQLERQNSELDLSNIESISNADDNSPATSVTTPATWRDRRSMSSTWSGSGGRGQAEKLLRVAERLNLGIENNDDDHHVI